MHFFFLPIITLLRDLCEWQEFNIYYYKSQVHRFSKNLGAHKILDVRQVTWSKLLTEDPQMLGSTHSKFSCLGDLTPGIYVPMLYVIGLLHPS
jgi:hypothetical protein